MKRRNRLVESIIRSLGQPSEIDILDVGDEDRIALIYTDGFADGRGKRSGIKSGLNDREMNVLILKSRGGTNEEIAKELNFSEASIDRICRDICRKTGSRNIAAAIYKKRNAIERALNSRRDGGKK